MVRHGISSCSRRIEEEQKRTSPTSHTDRDDLEGKEVVITSSQSTIDIKARENSSSLSPVKSASNSPTDPTKIEYVPWMLV